jgi:uncharacterized RDD family membrane protein YckC
MNNDLIIYLFIFVFIIIVLIAIIKSVSIKTKPELRSVKEAEWWRRLFGFLIDTMLIMLIASIVSDINNESELKQRYFAIIYVSYCFFFELLISQTIGKLIFGTIVISQDTLSKPTIAQIFIRSICRIIPFEAFSYINSRPCGWHDSISNTIVVTKKELDSSINEETDKKDAEVPKTSNFFNPLNELKKLPTGIYRLLLVGWLILPLIVAFISGSAANDDEGGTFLGALICSVVIYYIFVRLGIWVYFGFREEKRKE